MSYTDTFKKFLKEEALGEKPKNYMFFSNLKQIHRQCELLLNRDEAEINNIIENGHDWAEDHLSSATEVMDQVFDFIMNEISDDVNEISTSAGAGGYETPNAFGELSNDNIEMLGYKKVKKKAKSSVKESTFVRISSQLHL
jgi:hypothetical protein